MAEKLFEQLKNGEVNPARILSAYEDAEQQREVAALFNATVPVETKAELEKAIEAYNHRDRRYGLVKEE